MEPNAANAEVVLSDGGQFMFSPEKVRIGVQEYRNRPARTDGIPYYPS
jgi:hypothetical protein